MSRDGKSEQKSVVLLCGTHVDLAENEKENEKVEELEKQLKDHLKESTFYQDNLVEYATQHQEPAKRRVLFKINNRSGGKEEVDKYRCDLKELIEKRFRKLEIPASWFMLSMLLRLFASKKNRCMISIKECLDIGKRLGMREEMVEFALKFLHKYIGIVMYFHDIDDEHLKHHVICSPQVIFKSISELIFEVYAPHNDIVHVGPCQYDRFKETGQFSLHDIKVEDKDDLLPVNSLAKLLVHLNIAAKISDDDCYILPAVLKTSPIDKLLPSLVLKKPEATQSLLVHFNTGFLPLGVFCALIANLVASVNNNFTLLQGEYDGCEYFVKRNKVTFRAFGKYNVTLISWLKYIEIRICHPPKHHAIDAKPTNALATNAKPTNAPSSNATATDALATNARHLSEICPYVRKTVCETLDNVISTMKKKRFSDALTSDYSLGFKCANHSNFAKQSPFSPGHEPLALVPSDEYIPTSVEIPSTVKCLTCVNSIGLSEGMKDWYRHRQYATLGKSVCLEIPKFITASTCSSDSSMKWKEGPEAKFVTDRNPLKISSVTNNHLGNYTYEIRSGGKLMFKGHVELIEVPTKEVNEGEDTNLTVTAVGSLPLTYYYQWTRDCKKLEDNKDFSGSSTYCLHIQKAHIKLRGEYCCRVSNNEGEHTSTPTSLTIVNLKYSGDFDCEELAVWLEQNEISGTALQAIREQEIDGETFWNLPTIKKELVMELGSPKLTAGAKAKFVKLIAKAHEVESDLQSQRPTKRVSKGSMDSAEQGIDDETSPQPKHHCPDDAESSQSDVSPLPKRKKMSHDSVACKGVEIDETSQIKEEEDECSKNDVRDMDVKQHILYRLIIIMVLSATIILMTHLIVYYVGIGHREKQLHQDPLWQDPLQHDPLYGDDILFDNSTPILDFTAEISSIDFKNGVQLSLPKNANQPSKMISFKVKPAFASNKVFVLPDGIEAASPTFLISTISGTVSNKFTLTIEHWVITKTEDETKGLVFLVADSKPSKEYHFKMVNVGDPMFKVGARNGSITTNHFSWWIIGYIKRSFGIEGATKGYSIRLYKSPEDSSSRVAILFITILQGWYINRLQGFINNSYPEVSKKAIDMSVHEPVYFTEDEVTVESNHASDDWMFELDKTLISKDNVDLANDDSTTAQMINSYPPRIVCRFTPISQDIQRTLCTLTLRGLSTHETLLKPVNFTLPLNYSVPTSQSPRPLASEILSTARVISYNDQLNIPSGQLEVCTPLEEFVNIFVSKATVTESHAHSEPVKTPKSKIPTHVRDSTLIKPDDRPQITELRRLKLQNGDTIDLVIKIGTSYPEFGIHILRDIDLIDIIEQGCHYKPKCIVAKILSDWLKGKGRGPVTWTTFVECLRESKLEEVAMDVERQFID